MYKVGVGSMPSRLLASPFETLAGNGKVKKLTNIFRGVETTNQTRFTIKSRARSRLAECCRGSTSKDWLDCAEKRDMTLRWVFQTFNQEDFLKKKAL